jgi:pectin methylesterase-like acyl-CoA thioesterase
VRSGDKQIFDNVSLLRWFEYANTGAGAEITNAATRPQLADADAARYTATAYLAGTDGWNPTV